MPSSSEGGNDSELENDLLLLVTGAGWEWGAPRKRGNMNFKMERVREKITQTDEQ